MNIVRAYKRSMARTCMEREGYRKINKHHRGGKTKGSYFSNHWREQLPSAKKTA